jgi:putative phage-type endonuclease
MKQTTFRIGPEQHTAEWFALRKQSVTSSDIAVLMDCHIKGKTPLQLYNEKIGIAEGEKENSAMRRGTDLEPFARTWCESHYGVSLNRPTAIHPEIDGFMASLDGISDDGRILIEIKCGDKACKQAADGIIADYYMAQCQWHLFVTGCKELLYVPFDGFAPVEYRIKGKEGQRAIMTIPRSEPYIEEAVERATRFLECIRTKTPPGDVAARADMSIECPPEYVQAMEMYIQLDRIEKEAAEKKKDFRNALIDLGDDGDFVLTHGGIPRIKLKRTNGGSKTDWQAICNELKPSEALLRKHTKDTIGHYVLSICKEK